MKKEEFLAMSLPFGLKMQSNMDKKDIVNVYGIELNEGLFHADTDEYSWYCIDLFRPILHPLSDLTKTIEHNGEKFVPIIELARTGFDVCDDFEIKTRSKEGISGCMFSDSDGIRSVFAYHYDRKSFGAHLCDDGAFITVYNQFIMFQKLIELHFDLAGLIDKSEAIDVNSLEINPYK